MSLFAGAVAIAVSVSAIPAQAQFSGFENNGQWQERKQQLIETLELTETQVSQIEAARSEMRSQLEGTLTAEQRSTLEEALQSGQAFREAMQSVNLTDAQRQQIRTAAEGFRAEAQTILTEEQRQQWRQLAQERRGSRPNR
ncbi:MAG: hypothetical protein HC838_04640 [Spirulinaceae cyanobacterium RM2_2_10]|nr:hypothetical protein [Spirulinaceae cyanobacterium RM2_2_10]